MESENKITITKNRYQEVIDHINDVGGTKFTVEHIVDADLPFSLQAEISNNTYTDTCQREQIMDHISNCYLSMSWPCFGSSDSEKKEWDRRAKVIEVI